MTNPEIKNLHLSVRDFSRYPGPRTESQGPDSAEVFLRELLKPMFRQAEHLKAKLIIDLDGTEGYSTAFLDGSFGELARELGSDRVLRTMVFVTKDEPSLEDEIKLYMRQLEI